MKHACSMRMTGLYNSQLSWGFDQVHVRFYTGEWWMMVPQTMLLLGICLEGGLLQAYVVHNKLGLNNSITIYIHCITMIPIHYMSITSWYIHYLSVILSWCPSLVATAEVPPPGRSYSSWLCLFGAAILLGCWVWSATMGSRRKAVEVMEPRKMGIFLWDF